MSTLKQAKLQAGFMDEIANYSWLHCLGIPSRDLNTKKTKPKIEIWPEFLGIRLEL